MNAPGSDGLYFNPNPDIHKLCDLGEILLSPLYFSFLVYKTTIVAAAL